jgi:hypothetical protein
MRRRVLIGVVVGAVLAMAGWAYGHQRYGQLLNEWRWRHQLRGVKVTQAAPSRPASALLFPLAASIAGISERGDTSCRCCSGSWACRSA